MSIVSILRTPHDSERAVDENGLHYFYNHNRNSEILEVCSERLPEWLAKRISSSSLVGENLPEHDPPTNLMKHKAKEVEISAIKNVAAVPGSSAL
jgi:hypothetical protein